MLPMLGTCKACNPYVSPLSSPVDEEELERILGLLRGHEGSEDDQDDDSESDEKDESDDDEDDDEGEDKLGDPGKRALERQKKRIRALRKQNEEFAAKVKKFEEGEKSGKEKAEGELGDVKAERDQLLSLAQDLRVENAILADNTYEWIVSKKRILKLIDRSDIDFDEDGNIEGLREALDDLAKESPELLRKKSKDDEDDNEDDKDKSGDKSAKNRRTGRPAGDKKPDDAKLQREKLLSQYPALRGRML